MNAVIYARYSSHNQTEQSIEGQLRDCYEYAKRNDWPSSVNTSTVPFPARRMNAPIFSV